MFNMTRYVNSTKMSVYIEWTLTHDLFIVCDPVCAFYNISLPNDSDFVGNDLVYMWFPCLSTIVLVTCDR